MSNAIGSAPTDKRRNLCMRHLFPFMLSAHTPPDADDNNEG